MPKLFQSMLIQLAFFGFILFKVSSSEITFVNDESWVPLNFKESVIKINKYESFFTNLNHSSLIKYFDINLNEIVKNSFNNFYVKQNNIQNHQITYPNISEDCSLQLEFLVNGLKQNEEWAIKFFDSFGKIPSGILNGNLAWLGEFGECRNISAMNGNFSGNYVILLKPIDPLDTFKPSSSLSLKYGFCAPNRCTALDIDNIINYIIDSIPPNITESLPFKLNLLNVSYIQIQQEKILDSPAILTLTVICVIVVLVAIGTIYDIYKRVRHYLQCQEILSSSITLVNEESTLDENFDKDIDNENLYFLNLSHEPLFFRILVNFSAYSNSKKIFKINSSGNQQLKCLHGIRVLSLCWVILGHSYVFSLGYSDNIFTMFDWLKRFSFQIITNAVFSVDSFFVLSGLLTCFIFLREIEKAGSKLSFCLIFKYYFHRIWRLSPPYFIMMLISANLSQYFGLGPLYPPNGFEANKCRDTWVWNVLYINNLVQTDQMCFGISWYLSNDMQFHWIAPIILIPLAFKKAVIAMLVLALLMIGNLIAIPVILYKNLGMEAAQFGGEFIDFFSKFYIKPWCRIAPFLIGIVTGYLILLHKKKYRFKISKRLNLFFWIISLVICGLVVFGLYPDANRHPLSRLTHIVYQTLCRTAWSIGLCFIIFSCVTSNGGLINKILSWSIWLPLSRLSYSTFLCHVLIIMYFNVTQEHLVHIQDVTMIYYFTSHVIFSYAFGYFVSIFFEIPLIGLEKFLFNRS